MPYCFTMMELRRSTSTSTVISWASAICRHSCMAIRLFASFGSELTIMIFRMSVPKKLTLMRRRLMASSMA